MRATFLLAAVALLDGAIARDYMPMHKRHTYSGLVNDYSYLGMLSRRDSCSDAFGDNASDTICDPDFTLCCVRDGQEFPSCQTYLDKGWCCVGEGDDDFCYIDQKSVCEETSSVKCTELSDGTDEACCPKLTTCEPSIPGSLEYVRCNILKGDLIIAHNAANPDKTSTTAAETSTTTETETSTTEGTSTTTDDSSTTTTTTSRSTGSLISDEQNGNNGSGSSGIGGGAIAGIVIGSIAVLALIIAGTWWLHRRSQRGQYQAAPQPTIPQYYENKRNQPYQQGQGYDPAHQYAQGGGYYQQQPSELPVDSAPIEMDANISRPR